MFSTDLTSGRMTIIVSLLTELAVVLILRTHWSAFRSRPSRLLLWTTLVVGAATLTIPFLGPVSSVFGFVPLSALQMGTVAATVIGYIVATEGAKVWFYKRKTIWGRPCGRTLTLLKRPKARVVSRA